LRPESVILGLGLNLSVFLQDVRH